LGLDETSRAAYNSGETQTCHFVLLSGSDKLCRNSCKRLEAKKRYIRKNPRNMYARVPHTMAQFVINCT